MPFENEHAARIRQTYLFDKESYRRTEGGKAVLPGSGLITVPKTISIIWAKLKTANKPTDNPLVQSLRFPVKKWTSSEVQKWLKSNKVKYLLFEPAKKNSNNSLHSIDMENINKPLLLFAPIYDYIAADFIDKMNDYPDDEDLWMWVNSPGGRVFAGWSIIGAMEKRKGKNKVCVMGHAASMSVYFPLFADYSEGLEVTKFMIHRADGYVSTPEEQEFLNKINSDLRRKMEERLDMDVFESVTGKTMKQIFDSEKRIDVWIDAKQAKKIKLIDKIRKFEPKELKAYNEFVAFADFSQRSENTSQRSENTSQRSDEYKEPEQNYFNNNQNSEKMTLEELKSQHPELYKSIYDSGHKDGISAEKIRTKSWLAYLEIDKENVISSIKEGKEFTPDVMAEMSVKMSAKVDSKKIEDDSKGKIPTDPSDDKTQEQKDVEAFDENVKEGLDVESINTI